MDPKPRLSLADVPHRLRDFLGSLPQRWQTWREGLREDPALLWHGPVPRLAGIILFGLLLIVGLRWLVAAATPASTVSVFEEATPWATLYVACTNPACWAAYSTRQPMDFKTWPLKCEKCGQMTVYRAQVCPTCRNWYATPPGGVNTCPRCAEKKAADQRQAEPTAPTKKSDDAEDPW